MSIKTMSRVWEHSQQSGTKLLLLLAIADHANDEGVAWPGMTSLSRKIRASLTYTKELIKELLTSGDLELVKSGGGHNSNTYRVVVGEVPGRHTSPEAYPTGTAGLPAVGRHTSLQGGGMPPPNHHRNIIKPSYACKDIPEPLRTPEFEEAWKGWMAYRAEIKKKITPSTQERQLKRLAKHPPPVAIAMIEQSIEKGWQGLFELKDTPASSNGRGITVNEDGSIYA